MDYLKFRSRLTSKGEAKEDRRHEHVFFFIEVDGKEEKATKISYGAKGQIPDDILKLISHQMRLTNDELVQFVGCELGRREWLELWKERGYSWRRSY